MSRQMMLFICLLVINTLAALIYLLWSIYRKNKGCVFRTVVMLLCPGLGICFFMLSYILYRLFFSVSVDLEDVIFSKERVKAVTHAEEERERNMVPLEEAIEVTDEKDLRGLMMNVVRGDIKNFLATIALALNSKDTETAHYAASVLQDAINDFHMNVEKQKMLVEEGGADIDIHVGQLIDYMNSMLEQKVFTDMEQESYVGILDEMGDLYYDNYPGRMPSSQYEAISMRLLEIGDFENCGKWCDRAEYHYPNTLSTYTCRLKLYFAKGQRQRFFETIDELKKSDVVIDSETLEMIRVFVKG